MREGEYVTGFSSEIDQTKQSENPSDHTEYRSHKTALECYSFLISWFVSVGEKMGQSGLNEVAVGGRKVSLSLFRSVQAKGNEN